MTGEEIPLESKIIAVADIFDALTSERPYKKAWTNADAFALLKKLAGVSLDNDCVDALIDNQDEVKNIQQTFHDEGMHC
jgi:HD-GYP domain-containing protein (c-di-GMP phosphodiesterase class II)